MKRMALISFVFAAACSDANVAGNYTAEITNRADGCSIGWTSGETATATFSITQSGSDITLMVSGLAGIFVAGQLGTNAFTGEVDGDSISLDVIGTVPKSSGQCSYTFNGTISATHEGDGLEGQVEYRAATNGHADCASREKCTSVQAFSASRPPAP